MEMLSKYNHKEIWLRSGKDFTVEVVRWEMKGLDEIIYMWNVYCYIYPKHRLFEITVDEEYGSCPVENLNCGCTFVKWNKDKNNNVVSKQYGSDYGHIWDEGINKIKNPEENWKVFNDAESLFQELSGELTL